MSHKDALISDDEIDNAEITCNGWNEDNESFLCLFCSKTLPSPEEIFLHCFNDHMFNIYEIKNKHNLDCYSYIKFINFTRSRSFKSSEYSNILPGVEPWNDDSYLSPHFQNDLLLCFDIESCSSNILLELKSNSINKRALNNDECITNLNIAQISEGAYKKLLDRLKVAENLNIEYLQKLKDANRDIDTMRNMVNRVLDEGGDKIISLNNKDIPDFERFYFESYAHYSIHEEMLKDKVRTETYMKCIMENSDLFMDAIVLDVGCGTGILSLFAARAGAKLVISVDMSDIVYNTMEIVIKNGFEDKIKVLKGRIEDVKLPVEKVDIIISEWMGYCLLYESMLDSVLFARDKFLSQKGKLLPSHTSIQLVGISDINETQVNFWDNVYGFDMSCMKSEVCEEASIQNVDKNKIITNQICLKAFELSNCLLSELDFTTDFILESFSDSKITALILFFDVNFDCKKQFSFSTSPECEPTHWKQTVLNLKEPINTFKSKQISGRISIMKDVRDHRALKISLTLDGYKHNFRMQ